MSNFDPNTWYAISNNEETLWLDGTPLFEDNGTWGTAFMRNVDADQTEEQWQIFSVSDSSYVLRTAASGPTGFLVTGTGKSDSDNDENNGQTVPSMYNCTRELRDKSVYWQISPWGNGRFYLTNTQNGSDWHLQIDPNGLCEMNSNITGEQDGQEFHFKALKKINDPAFSSVSLATSTSSPDSGPDRNSSSNANDSSINTSSGGGDGGGLSTGAEAGIGVGVALAVILAIIAGVLLWRRRRRRAAYGNDSTNADGRNGRWPHPAHELDASSNQKPAEMSAYKKTMELPAQNQTLEMPATQQSGAKYPPT